MIYNLLQKSTLLSYYFRFSGMHESYYINALVSICNEFLSLIIYFIRKRSNLCKVLLSLKLKSISIISFLLFLILGLETGQNSEILILSRQEYIASIRRGSLFEINRILFLGFILYFIFALIKEYAVKKKVFAFQKLEVLILIFLILVELSTLTSINLQASIIWLSKFMVCILVYFILSRFHLTQKQIFKVVYVLVIGILLESTIGILQALKGNLLEIPLESINRELDLDIDYLAINSFTHTPFFRAVGTFSHSNELGHFLALTLPICIFLILKGRKKIKIVGYAISTLSLITTYFTFSRWGLAMYFLAFFSTLFLIKKYSHYSLSRMQKNMKIYVAIFCLFMIFLFSHLLVGNRLLNYSFNNDWSMTIRLELISQSLYTLKQHPFGIGPGTFQLYFVNNDFTDFQGLKEFKVSKIYDKVSQIFLGPVHNMYLLVANETGIVSLFLVLLIVLEITQIFFKRVYSTSLKIRAIFIVLFVPIAIFLIYGMWDMRTFSSHSGLFFWVQLALFINVSNST